MFRKRLVPDFVMEQKLSAAQRERTALELQAHGAPRASPRDPVPRGTLSLAASASALQHSLADIRLRTTTWFRPTNATCWCARSMTTGPCYTRRNSC